MRVAWLRLMRQLADRFAKDHERLELLLRQLAESAACAESSKLCEVWTDFETCLTRHLEAEERYLLPLVEAAHPAEVAAIREDHLAIRRLVAELGVRVDLHAVSEPAVTDLLRLLHEHASSEERALYGWADQVVSTAVGRCINAMMSLAPRGVRELLGRPRNVEQRDPTAAIRRSAHNP